MQQISKGQLIVLVINILIPTAHIQVLLTSIKYAQEDAWLATTIGYLVVLVSLIIYWRLVRLYPEQNILQFTPQIVGNLMGKLFSSIFFGYSFLVATYTLQQFTTLMTTIVYRQISGSLFRILLMILVVYISSLGVEVIFRTSDFIFLAVGFVTVIIGLALVPEVNLELLKPVLNQDLTSLLQGAVTPVAFLGQVMMILFFNDLVKNKQKMLRDISLGLTFGFLFVVSFVVIGISIYGAEVASKLWFIPFVITRQVTYGGVLRVEIFLLVVWIGLIFIKLATFFWISRSSLSSLFDLEKEKFLNIPLAVLVVVFATSTWENIVEFQRYIETTYSSVLLIIQLFIPLLLYLIAVLKGKEGHN
ncbi:GerAB/ArcD/ProY family transporter [Halanaerobaculum tunisiense]